MNGAKIDPIRFQCVVYKVQTLTDNGIRVTLDLPETEVVALALLASCQMRGAVLLITAEAQKPSQVFDLDQIAEDVDGSS